MSHKASAACRRGYLHDKNVIQHVAHALAGQGQIQCPLYLSAQLPGLLLYSSTAISLSILGLFQGSLELKIKQSECNVSRASAFGHGNSLPETHTVRRASERQSCARMRKNRQLNSD